MSDQPPDPPPEHIGTLNENPLHAALKAWLARPEAATEVRVDGYVIDIVQGDLLVEIQTRGFSQMKHKLVALTADHAVQLVHPIAREKWIVKLAEGGSTSRRKSPKRGAVVDVFRELVSFPHLLAHPNFSLEVLLTQEEEVRRFDGRRGWRRKGWVTEHRRLLDVVERHLFETPGDIARLLPDGLADPFTTGDLATALGRPRRLAQQMAYCLRALDVIRQVGKRGNACLYTSHRDN